NVPGPFRQSVEPVRYRVGGLEQRENRADDAGRSGALSKRHWDSDAPSKALQALRPRPSRSVAVDTMRETVPPAYSDYTAPIPAARRREISPQRFECRPSIRRIDIRR